MIANRAIDDAVTATSGPALTSSIYLARFVAEFSVGNVPGHMKFLSVKNIRRRGGKSSLKLAPSLRGSAMRETRV